jgi:peptide chain release factor subunit 1
VRVAAIGYGRAMHVSELTDDVLRDLSEVEADEPVVVSLFLNLDPSWFATPAARESQISSLLSSLDAQIREDGVSDDAREALEADRARIEQFLEDELDAGEAEAIAVYSALALDVFRVVKLAQPVESRVHVDLRPLLEPVMGQEDEGDWCVLLVTRETGRIFRGGPTGIREVFDVESDVKNQHQAGGWSQARFERSVEQEVEWHLERVTELLFRAFKRRPFEHLIIGANNESLRPALTGETHEYLLERVRGWVDIDERLAGKDDVFEAVRGVMEDHLAEQERELFARYEQARGTGGPAATGVEDVLARLVEQRVETLIVQEGAVAAGTKCVTCGWLGPAGVRRCPVDDTDLDMVDNIVEPAIQAAIQQSASVHVVAPGEGPEAASPAPFDEPMAAVLRY